jgi:membrane-associated phospholipid phosphatase
MNPAQVVTDLGNLIVAAAGAVVLFSFVWLRISRLVALVFGVCLGGVALATAGLKLASGQLFPSPWLAGALELSAGAPSGHVALATVVYGGAAVVWFQAGKGLSALAGVALAVLAVGGVSITRVTLGAHTVPDVLAGLLIGLPGLAVLWRALDAQGAGRRRVSARGALIGMILVVALVLASGLRISRAGLL